MMGAPFKKAISHLLFQTDEGPLVWTSNYNGHYMGVPYKRRVHTAFWPHRRSIKLVGLSGVYLNGEDILYRDPAVDHFMNLTVNQHERVILLLNFQSWTPEKFSIDEAHTKMRHPDDTR